MTTKTSGETIQQLADRTTQEGLMFVFVRARRITESLWKVSEEYHAGAIDHAEFGQRTRALWNEAESLGVNREVTRQLRDAR